MGAGAARGSNTSQAMADSAPQQPPQADSSSPSQDRIKSTSKLRVPGQDLEDNASVYGRAMNQQSADDVFGRVISQQSADDPLQLRSPSHQRRQKGMARVGSRVDDFPVVKVVEAEEPDVEENGADNVEQNDLEMVGRRASEPVKEDMLEPDLEDFLTRAFEQHFMLKSMPKKEYKQLFLAMKVKYAVPEEVVVRQGHVGDSVYFIRHGNFTLVQNGTELTHTLGPGDSFGELALLYCTPTSTTVMASKHGELWKMERNDFLKCKERLGSSQMEVAIEFLQGCQDFRYLKEQDQKALAEVCTCKSFDDGSIVLRDSEVGELMYIVMKGQVSASEDTFDMSDRGAYGKYGSVIGSVGVLYGKRQAVGAYAKGSVECLCLGKAALSNFSAAVIDVLRRSAFKAMLYNLPRNPGDPEPWKILSQEEQHLLISRAEDGFFEPGEIIFAPGDGAQLVIVVSGQVAILRQVLQTREQGDYVFVDEDTDVLGTAEKVVEDGQAHGKQELLEGISMSRFGVAVGKVRLHRITHNSVLDALGDSLMEVMRYAEIKRVLSDIFLFKNLREEQIENTVRELEQCVFSAGEIIVQQNDPARHFYLIQRGNVIVRKGDKVLRTLGRWDYFGERGLLLQEKRSATCQALDECICLVLDADEFFRIVGHFKPELERRMHLQDLNLTMSDMQCKAVVGRGTYGVVRLVTPKGKDYPEYALKCVKKTQVVKGCQEKAIVMEREVNAQCYHPCIMQFIKTFQDKDSVYFLTEFLGGGDLFYAIRAIGALTQPQSQFFSGSIVLGIEYLHGRGIMYRDLKPENVLLDFAGKAKLVDFGCCKKEMRTSTLIGTPEYLAPEVIKGKGYNCCVDWWSLGVMLYEFVVGPIPFGAGEEDQMKLFRAISEAPLTFPDNVPNDAVQVLSGLLERRADRRLGASSLGAKEIKQHQWYKGFNWDALAGGFFPPPWQPDAEAQMKNWEEPDGNLMDHVSKERYSFPKGMEWAKAF